MRNITVSVPDDAYRKARIWAAERDVSVSAIVAYLIQNLPDQKRAARRFPLTAASNPSPQPTAEGPKNMPAEVPPSPHTTENGVENR